MGAETARGGWGPQLAWFLAGAVGAFLVPFLLSSLLDLHHDLYLALYFAFVGGLLVAWARANAVDVQGVLRRNWRWSVLLGVVIAALAVRNVLSEDSTPRPDGLYFAFELVWRGAVYGAVDALLLTVFPCLLVLTALAGDLAGLARKITYGGVSLLLIMVITATYHLGYEQYRADGIGAPEFGNVLFSVPMLATANPIGSVIGHSAMHVAAVAHEYEDDVRLPPTASAD